VAAPDRPAPPTRRRTAVVFWLAAAWLVPVLAYARGVAAVLPPLVLALTAGLLRGGRTLLDRRVLATALLLGAVAAAGLLCSAGPWGTAPGAGGRHRVHRAARGSPGHRPVQSR
jgi:hypothetical protein